MSDRVVELLAYADIQEREIIALRRRLRLWWIAAHALGGGLVVVAAMHFHAAMH